jgi:release factor glutamine methyltransferase
MTNAHPIKTTLLLAATQLKAQSIETENAKLEAQLLLQHVLNVNRAWLISHENDALQANIHAAFEALLKRRLNGEPIAYILGYREFYGLNLKVTPDTLIPRADTEALVEAVLARIALSATRSPQPSPTRGEGVNTVQNLADPSPSPRRGRGVGERGDVTILDLGTGTGAIALAIAKHRPQAYVTAMDASQAALNIAIENAGNLNIPNVKFILSDWFSALNQEKFDLIVSNPPYIEATDAHLKQGDLRFEPISALASGADGLDAIRHIIKDAPLHLNPHGWLMLEHGYNQASQVAALLKQAGFIEISHAKDLSGIDRVTLGQLF